MQYKIRKMKTAQKFKTFSDLKQEKENIEKKVSAEEVKYLLELMRRGKIPVESKINKNAK